jgi:hypothetical protein
MSRVLNVLNAIVAGGRDVKCEACGKDFVCGVSLKGCWCSEIKLDDETRTDMRSKYKDCLCRECLEKLRTSLDAVGTSR